MRTEGTLARWNDERGFGFISPTKSGTAEIFVHISAFPKDGQRPFVGELISFETETDKNGKTRAVNLLFPNRTVRLTHRPQAANSYRRKPGFLGRTVPVLVVLALVYYAYGKLGHRVFSTEAISVPQAITAQQAIEPITSPTYQCDGRQHCSQMTSCAEATFFLKNCPGVKMDGDNDGIPCEEQLCGH